MPNDTVFGECHESDDSSSNSSTQADSMPVFWAHRGNSLADLAQPAQHSLRQDRESDDTTEERVGDVIKRINLVPLELPPIKTHVASQPLPIRTDDTALAGSLPQTPLSPQRVNIVTQSSNTLTINQGPPFSPGMSSPQRPVISAFRRYIDPEAGKTSHKLELKINEFRALTSNHSRP